MTTIRLLLSLAFIYNSELKQLDINNAFLHGELKEDVYMVAPPGLTSILPGQVCKLKKLYMVLSKLVGVVCKIVILFYFCGVHSWKTQVISHAIQITCKIVEQ